MEVVVSDSRRKCCVGNPITLSYSCHWILAHCNILNDHTHCPCPPYEPPPPHLPLSNEIKHGVNWFILVTGATGGHPVFSYIRIPKHNNPKGSLCPSGLEFCSAALNERYHQTLLSTEHRPATPRHQMITLPLSMALFKMNPACGKLSRPGPRFVFPLLGSVVRTRGTAGFTDSVELQTSKLRSITAHS